MTYIQYLDPLTWPILQYDYGIHFMPVSDSAPDGWGPPFVDGGGAPINGGMGTVGTTPVGIVVTRTGSSSYSMRRGIAANTPAISQTQRCSAIDGQLIFRSADSNRYWCHPNSSVIYYKNAQLTTAPATVCGLSVFEESGSKYLCVITAVSSGNDITITAYVRPWLDSYVNGDLYDAVTNPEGWQQVGSQTFNEPADPDDSDYYGLRIRQAFYFSDDGKSAVSVAWTWWALGQTRSAPRGLFNITVSASSATISWSRVRPTYTRIQYGGGATGTRDDYDPYTAIADYDGSILIEGVISAGQEVKTTVTASATVVEGESIYAGTKTTVSSSYSYTKLTIGSLIVNIKDDDTSTTFSWEQTVVNEGGSDRWNTVSQTNLGGGTFSTSGIYLGGDIASGHHLYREEASSDSISKTCTSTYPSTTASGSGSTDTTRTIEVKTESATLVSHSVGFSEPTSCSPLSPVYGDFSTQSQPVTETTLFSAPAYAFETFFVEPTTARCLGYQAHDGHMFAVVYGIFDLSPTYSYEPFYEFDSDQIIPYYTPVGTSVGAMIGIYGANPNYLDVRHV